MSTHPEHAAGGVSEQARHIRNAVEKMRTWDARGVYDILMKGRLVETSSIPPKYLRKLSPIEIMEERSKREMSDEVPKAISQAGKKVHDAIKGEALKEIGSRLREKRKELRWTQKELGVALGYPPNSAANKISQFENGRTMLTLPKLLTACRVLETCPDVLLGFADDTSSDIEQEARLLSEGGRKDILKAVRKRYDAEDAERHLGG